MFALSMTLIIKPYHLQLTLLLIIKPFKMKSSVGITRRVKFFVLALLTVVFVAALPACKKDKPSGNLMFYTFLNSTKFDAIKIYVNGKQVGELTIPHIEKPACGTASSVNVINVKLQAGEHNWYAKQFKGGVEIDEWDERSETVKDGECSYIKLTE